MTKSKITLNIPIEITIDVGEIKNASPEGARAYVGGGLVVPYYCNYKGDILQKVVRTPRVGDVVVVTKFDGVIGAWERRVIKLHPSNEGDFILDERIGENDYFNTCEDRYIAVYESTDESESND
ncbi:hypothetical protein AB6R62_000968 [Listeria monocytogenes]